MRFTPAFLDAIRDRVPISEVIATRVQWDKRKTNASRGDYWACCPFHGEKSPSFHCEDRKGRYHCFGCGVSGDHFRFLVELDGMSFPEAVERLADQAGLPMPVMDPREREREAERGSLFDVMEMATLWFESQLQAAGGAKARAYLRDRGLSPQVQQTFRLGYAPESRNALKEHLASKGVAKDQIEACGLVVFGPDIAVSYDRFRDRIMFPIPDSRGKIIAFGGRALRPDVPAKYLNSPETELFHKSNVLYNFAQARKAVQAENRVIAAEGYMDVIALHAGGFANAVAPLGTALTETQMELLWRLNPEPILCFDGDAAGLRAAWRAIDLAMPGLRPGRSLRFAMLPEGKDPDDLLRAEGPQAMRAVLDSALSLADLLWMRETASSSFETPERKAELEANLRQAVSQIRDEPVRRHYQQEMQGRLSSLFAPAGGTVTQRGRPGGERRDRGRGQSRTTGNRGAFAPSPALLNSPMMRRNSSRVPLREAALVCGVAHHPAILNRSFDEFASLSLSHPDSRKVQAAIIDCVAGWSMDAGTGDNAHGAREIAATLAAAGLEEPLSRMEEQLRENRIWQALPGAAFEDALDGWRQAHALHMKTRSLLEELRAAEMALANEGSDANLARLVHLQAELAREDGTEALIEGFGLSSGRPSRTF